MKRINRILADLFLLVIITSPVTLMLLYAAEILP